MNFLLSREILSYLNFIFVFFRITSFLIFSPVFSHKLIPGNLKVIFSLSISFIIYPFVRENLPDVFSSHEQVILNIIFELFFGSLLGFGTYLTFEGISLAASFTSYQMGFGNSSLFDPSTDFSSSSISALYAWFTLIVFFSVNLHHDFIVLIVKSFSLAEGKHFFNSKTALEVVQYLISSSGQLLITAIQLAMPFTFILLGCQVSISILSKAIPQLNALSISVIVTILLGLTVLFLCIDKLNLAIEDVIRVSLKEVEFFFLSK